MQEKGWMTESDSVSTVHSLHVCLSQTSEHIFDPVSSLVDGGAVKREREKEREYHLDHISTKPLQRQYLN